MFFTCVYVVIYLLSFFIIKYSGACRLVVFVYVFLRYRPLLVNKTS